MTKWKRAWHFGAFGLAAVATLAIGSSPARANGRFPATVSVAFQKGNAKTILVGTTFGLLMSTDDGASFGWTCEQNIGYGGTFDPTYAMAADGTIYAGTFDGLSISKDGGCSFAYAGGGLMGQWASDVQIASDDAVWVTTSSGGLANDVFVSRDGGKTFNGTGLMVDRAWWKTIRIAPTDPMRVYVSGYQLALTTPDGGGGLPTPLVYRSDDGGATWTKIAFAFGTESQIRFLAVSPKDEDLVFARVDGDVTDTLIRSDNGAVSFAPVATFSDDLLSFVARSDGMTYLAGAKNGAPLTPPVDQGDVRISTDFGMTWNPTTYQPRMSCAGARSDDELFACGANWKPDNFAVARSTDGQQWAKVFRFVNIAGPIACPAASPQVVKCGPIWPMIAEQFGIGVPDAGPAGKPDAATNPMTGGGGGGGCGCGISLGFVVVPFVGRRRRAQKRRAQAGGSSNGSDSTDSSNSRCETDGGTHEG